LGLLLGTARGVVKRVQPEVLTSKEWWPVVRLEPGDEVVAAVELRPAHDELVFITSAAQLLHFPLEAVRAQGRSGGGVAGIRLGNGERVIFFGAVRWKADNVAVTVSGSSRALPGTEAGAVKVTPLTDYPRKGRGTAGVRCHRFVRDEDTLVRAHVGPAPIRAAAASGAPVDVPEALGRRDGSGLLAAQPIAAFSAGNAE
jgi:DNA gyrase subunit A